MHILEYVNHIIDCRSFSFDDNYAYDFSFDSGKKEMTFYFDSYYDAKKDEVILNPCRYLISNWACMFISHEGENYKIVDDNTILPKCELILEKKEQGDFFFLYVMAEGYEYYYFKIYNASVTLQLADMSLHVNTYNDINDISFSPIDEMYIARISHVNNKDMLLDEIKTSLRVPHNVKCSWDNLADVLCSPFWLLNKWKHVVIVHDDISCMPEQCMSDYMEVINYCRLHSIWISFVFPCNGNRTDYFNYLCSVHSQSCS